MSDKRKTHIWGIEEYKYHLDEYVYIYCYKSRLTIRAAEEHHIGGYHSMSIVKVGDSPLIEADSPDRDFPTIKAFRPEQLTSLKGTIHFGTRSIDGSPVTRGSFEGFDGKFIKRIPDCLKSTTESAPADPAKASPIAVTPQPAKASEPSQRPAAEKPATLRKPAEAPPAKARPKEAAKVPAREPQKPPSREPPRAVVAEPAKPPSPPPVSTSSPGAPVVNDDGEFEVHSFEE